MADLTYLVDYLFGGGPEPVPYQSGDMSRDGEGINIADLTTFVAWMFQGGTAPQCEQVVSWPE